MLVSGLTEAAAQSPQCDRWRAELASLPRGGGSGNARAASQAAQVGAELSRTINAYRGMGCEAQQGLFFSSAPPQCGGLRGRIGQLQGQFASLQQQAQGGGGVNVERRAQLQAAIDNNCRAGLYQTPEPPRPRGFFEALFGAPEQPPMQQMLPQDDLLNPNADDKKGPRYGAGQAVCVKTCDGSFFPLATSPGGREGHEEMCKALCPAAETRVFYMNGSGDISDASTRGGEGYLSLANANKFTRTFDPTCGCRKPGESWSAALREAEDMLERKRGDVIVSEARAKELSQPRSNATRALTPREQRRLEQEQAKQQAAIAAALPIDPPAAPAEPNPVASQDSAGIGSIAWGTTVGTEAGRRIEVTASDGEKRQVRVVVPSPLTAGGQTTGSVTR